MDMKNVSKRITDVKDEIVRLRNIAASMEVTDMKRYPGNYVEPAYEGRERVFARFLLHTSQNPEKS